MIFKSVLLILISAFILSCEKRLTNKDIPYFLAAPTFQTSSEKYNWLNEIQTINKMVEIQFGDKGFVKYDVFVVK